MEKDGQSVETTKPLLLELIECEEKREFEKLSSSGLGSSGKFLPVDSRKKKESTKSKIPSKSGEEKGGYSIEETKSLLPGLIQSEEVLKSKMASELPQSEKPSNMKNHAQPGKVSEKSAELWGAVWKKTIRFVNHVF